MLNYISYFRGVAILFIVIGHLIPLVNFLDESNLNYILLKKVITVIIVHGTSLFVFISGFLFYYIFYKKDFKLYFFMKSKIKNVYVPYLFMIIPIFIKKILEMENISIKELILDVYSGRLLIATWYIPFAMLLFLSSNIFIKYIELEKYHKRIIIISLLISMVVHRPIMDNRLNIIQAWIYFFPIYCTGIYIAMKKEECLNVLNKMLIIIVIIFISICILQIKFNLIGGSFKNMFSYSGLDFMIAQKFFLCLFLITILKKLDDFKGFLNLKKILLLLAENSFPIFFIHCYLVPIIAKFLKLKKIKNINFILIILLALLCCGVSIIITKLIKLKFGKKSRVILGA